LSGMACSKTPEEASQKASRAADFADGGILAAPRAA
jgi:hypothetical protein